MATSKEGRKYRKPRGGVQSGSGKKNALRQVTKETNYREYPNGAVVYVGHVPDGFFEDQMRKYFSQFGRVGRIQLCRSKKTGKSKGFAFIEFQLKEVAEIAAEAMNNYLMFQKLMKCHVVPDEKLHPNLFKSSAFSRRKPILPHIINKRRHNQQQTDKQHKKSVLRMIRKKRKLVNKLNELGISYELPAEMFKRNKQDDVQGEKDVQSDKEAELLPSKKQRLSLPESKVPSSSPDSQNLQTSAKAKRKQKRSVSDEESGALEQEEQSVAVKKHKSSLTENNQPASALKQTTVKMIRRTDNKTPAKKSNLKLSRQTESECLEGDTDDGLLPAKKQRMTPPEMKQSPANKKMSDVKTAPKQNMQDGHDPSEKENITLSNASKITSPRNTAVAKESGTFGDLGTRKKSPKQVAKSPKQVTADVNGKQKKDFAQIQKDTTLLNTPVSLTDKTPEVKESARKTPKQTDKIQTKDGVDKDLEAVKTPRIDTENKKSRSIPSPRITRSKSTANVKATPTKVKTESTAPVIMTPKHKQSSSTPTTRVMRSAKLFNAQSPKCESPLQKLSTPGKHCATPTRVKLDSTKKKGK